MGFWSSVGGVVSSMAKSAAEATREAKELSLQWSGESDHFLARKYKSGSMAEKMAATAVFKEKYPDEEMRRGAMRDAIRTL